MSGQLTALDYAPITIHSGDGKQYIGGDQDWYPDRWQQNAGCGPTCCANIAAYLAAAHPELSALNPYDFSTMDGALSLMQALWQYVTPGRRGVNKTSMLAGGMEKYALSRGVKLKAVSLDYPALPFDRPAAERVQEFILQALSSGCPAAFLTLSSGIVRDLHRWHWITIMQAERKGPSGELFITVSDEGLKKEYSITKWLASTTLGGGFVYFTF